MIHLGLPRIQTFFVFPLILQPIFVYFLPDCDSLNFINIYFDGLQNITFLHIKCKIFYRYISVFFSRKRLFCRYQNNKTVQIVLKKSVSKLNQNKSCVKRILSKYFYMKRLKDTRFFNVPILHVCISSQF